MPDTILHLQAVQGLEGVLDPNPHDEQLRALKERRDRERERERERVVWCESCDGG